MDEKQIRELARQIIEGWDEWDGEAAQDAQIDQCPQSYDETLIARISECIRDFQELMVAIRNGE